MKILKIKSFNINSLKGWFTIDFNEFLKDESLFAITGPTGAGKSTILDIITCALYGRTARLATPPNELMSKHTGECLCEVEFEVKSKIYRSSWSQKRARKKANGNFQTAKMELVDVKQNRVIQSKLREVPKDIEQLSGLDFDRFTQSMMLSQGSFDAFLKAKESERSTLLEKITGTQIYKQVSQKVYDIYTSKKTHIQNEELLLGNIELLEKQILEEKSNKLLSLIEEKKQKDKEEQNLKKISTWLENLKTLQEYDKKYSFEFEQISQEKTKNLQSFLKLELANKALNIKSIFQELNSLEKTMIYDKNQQMKLEEEKKQLNKQISVENENFEIIKKRYEKQKISYNENSSKLKNLRVFQTKIEANEEQNRQISKKLFNQKQELAKLFDVETKILAEDETAIFSKQEEFSKKTKNLKNEFDVINKKYEQTSNEIIQLAKEENSTRDKLQTLKEFINSFQSYENLNKNLKNDKKEQEKYKTEIDLKNRLIEEKIKLVFQIETSFQALKQIKEKEILIKNYEEDRKKLKENQECFLCGSKQHPYLNHQIEIDINSTTQKIKKEEKKLQNEQLEQKNLEILVAELKSKLENKNQNIKSLNEQKTKIEEQFLNSDFKLNKDFEKQIEYEKKSCEQKLEKLDKLRQELQQLDAKKQKTQYALNEKIQNELKIKNIIETIVQLDKEQKELEKQLLSLQNQSKQILDVEDIDEFEKIITESINTISDKYNKIQTQLASLKSKKQSQDIQIKALEEKNIKNIQEQNKIKNKFEQALKDNSFKNQKEFEQAVLEKKLHDELLIFCKNIDENYTKIKTLKEDTRQKLKEHEKQNLTSRTEQSVNDELKQLQEAIDELQKTIGSVQTQLEIDTQNRKKHQDKIKQIQNKKQSFEPWAKLNEMIGSKEGTKFAKYAQGITLDQLIFLANKHLNILSPRYELQRSDDVNKQLEIQICDGFQGDIIRPVSTLSGGESFIVSLSLALGLSSLASQKISIDSLFLDEGFGTLDANSLDLALNALNQLQSSGKMIGVISHVEALKERIPLQIKVEPKGDGTSKIEFS